MKISHQHPSGWSAAEQRQQLLSLHGQCIAAIRHMGGGRAHVTYGAPKGTMRGR